MNERDFTYWLKGFLELSDSKELNEKQVTIIRNHLDLVFEKVTPDVDLNFEYTKEIPRKSVLPDNTTRFC